MVVAKVGKEACGQWLALVDSDRTRRDDLRFHPMLNLTLAIENSWQWPLPLQPQGMLRAYTVPG